MRHLDTQRHAWRVYFTPPAFAIPVFAGVSFTNAPAAATTALEIPARKGIAHIQHEVFGVVTYHQLKYVAPLPSQRWEEHNKWVADHPKYIEWLNGQREAKTQQHTV